MKYVYFLFLFCIVCITGYAQTATSYSFSSFSGAFVSIADTTADSISGGGMASDDGFTPAIPIGFTFTFCGVNYTTCAGDANGVLSLAGDSASYRVDSANIFGSGWLMPLWYDLYGSGRTAYYKTTGTPGNRVFTLEWHNWSLFGDEEASDTLNFQVKLYESTNVVQFVYGSNNTGLSTAVIGIANSTTDFQTLPYTASATTDTVFNKSCSEPDSGSIFQWCPPLVAPAAITGNAAACAGSQTTLADTSSAGVWSSNNSSVASVDSTGVVTGVSAGTATISYTISNACTSVASTDTVVIYPLPTADTVTGGGPYCAGASGEHVGLNTSDPGISYQLYRNDTIAIGSPMAGTGSPLDFGIDTGAGAYTVVAMDTTTGCTSNMYGSAIIVINPLPAVHNVTGGGSYCSGSGGVHVGLNGSNAGINYQLYYDTTNMAGVPIAGTGTPLDFGLDTGAGTYTVVATDTTTGCSMNMSDTAVIIINPLPPVHTVTGSGSYCAGTGGLHVGLNGSDTGIRYRLHYNDTGLIGSAVAGTGSPLDFGADTGAGIYTVTAANAITGCSDDMSGSATIVITPVVIPSVTIASSITDTICAGETIVFTAIPMHGGGEPSYQWMVNGSVAGSGSNTYGYIPVNGDIVSVKLTSDTVCAIPDTAIDTMTVVVHPKVTPTITLTVAPGDTVCEGTSVVITATPGYGGNAPSYAWIKNTVIVSTDTAYSYIPANGDNIYCVMQSDYFCRLTTTAYSNVIDMDVVTPVVPAVYIIAHPGTYVGHARADTFTAVVTDGGTDPSYQWYVNGAEYAGATSSTFRDPTIANKDSVSCIVTRNDVCHLSNFSSLIIRVTNVGVGQIASASDIKLIPNPNNGTFTISGSFGSSLSAGEDVDVEIADMLGQVVYRNKITSQDGAIDTQIQTSTLANGIYILNLRSESGNTAIRFVVER